MYNQGFKGMRTLIISSPFIQWRYYGLVINKSGNRAKCTNNHEICLDSIVKLITNLHKEDCDLTVSQSKHPRYALLAFTIVRILERS